MKDVFGDANYAGFFEQNRGAWFSCKFCNISQSVTSTNKVDKIISLFNAEKFPFKLRERNTFYEYLEE